MNYAFQEAFEEQYGWSWIETERCPICGQYFLRIADADPGSHEQAIMVAFMCNDCSPEHGSMLLDFEDHHFRDERTVEQLYAGEGLGVEEPDYDDTDLDKEKWDNYYRDPNQCGIVIDWHS